MMTGKAPEAIVVLAGILQTGLYSDFFYIYYKRYTNGTLCEFTYAFLVYSMVAPSSSPSNHADLDYSYISNHALFYKTARTT